MECVFCKIINKELPAYIVYEDEDTMAFLDINPVSKGHLLVVPKKHYSRLSEIPQEELKRFFQGLQNVVKMVESNLSKHYNIVVNQGELAGQVINHLHFHIIPRYGNEQIFIWLTHKLSKEEAQEVLEKLGKNLIV